MAADWSCEAFRRQRYGRELLPLPPPDHSASAIACDVPVVWRASDSRQSTGQLDGDALWRKYLRYTNKKEEGKKVKGREEREGKRGRDGKRSGEREVKVGGEDGKEEKRSKRVAHSRIVLFSLLFFFFL